MTDNIKPKELQQSIEEIRKEIPNLVLPTMGIVPDDNKITINNNDYIKTKEDKDVK